MEIPPRADQHEHRALRLLAARPNIFARGGHIAASYRRRNGRTYGPYYRLAYREAGRQRSIYLGREGQLVERVRCELMVLQQPRRQALAFSRLERRIRHAVRIQKKRANELLRPYGLRLKGAELRGLRFSPFRRFLPRRASRLVPSLRAFKPTSFHPAPNLPAERLHRFLTARKALQGW